MIKKLVLGTFTALIIGAGALAYLAAPYVATPEFVVKNESGVSIEVTAQWRERSKKLGSLPAGSEQVFEVNDEAAMKFRVVYPSGRVITSEPAIYFTSGTKVIAVVGKSSIDVSTEF